jgi:hypothetical protein
MPGEERPRHAKIYAYTDRSHRGGSFSEGDGYGTMLLC